MPIDPSIPLQVQSPKIMGPGDMLSLQNVSRQGQMQQVQLQEAQQGQEKKNMLRQVMQGATDPSTGRLTPQGLAQITQIDPSMGLQLGHQQEQLRLQDLQVNQKKDELKRNIGTSYVTAYDRYLQQTGGNSQQAQQLAQKDTLAAIDDMEKGGTLANVGLDPTSIQKLKTLPPPEQMRSMVIGLGGKVPDVNPSTRTERKRISGANEIQEEWDPVSKSWRKIGEGPRFAGTTDEGKAPPGYRFSKTNPGELEPIPGGPGAPRSAITDKNKDLHGEDFIKTLSPLDRNTVKGLLDYDIDPKTIPGGMVMVDGQKRSRREYMIDLARQADPSYSETSYREKNIALGEFQKTKGNAVRFLNVSIDHIDTAAEYAKALQNGDMPKLNQLKNWWQQETGKPAPNTFNGIKDIVAAEVVKGAIGGPGGVEERKANAEKVKAANSPEQLSELFTGWTKLMAGQMKGLEKAYESGTKLTNFRDKYLLQRARSALEGVSDGGSPASSPSSGAAFSDAEKEKRYQAWKASQGK